MKEQQFGSTKAVRTVIDASGALEEVVSRIQGKVFPDVPAGSQLEKTPEPFGAVAKHIDFLDSITGRLTAVAEELDNLR